MSFGMEMKDFIEAFQVSSGIVDKRRQRAIEEESEKNRSSEAAARAQATQDRFETTQEGIRTRHADSMRLQGEAGNRAERGLANEKIRIEQADNTQRRQDEAAEYADWKARYEFDPETAGPPPQRGQPTEAIPTTTNTTAKPGDGEGGVPINYQIVSDAVDAGMKKLSREGEVSGINKIMDGEGAPSPETVQQVDDIVDPEHAMDEGERTLARMEATYKYYLTEYKGKDGYERASEAAAQWIQHARGMAAIQATAALTLNEQGDTVGAARKMIDAHNSIPDGRVTTLDEANMTFQTIDKQSGDIVQEGDITPELIDEIAASFTKGPAVFQLMLEAAQRSTNFNAGDKEGKTPKEKPVTSAPLEEVEPLAAEQHNEAINEALLEITSGEITDIDGKPVWANTEEFIAQVGEDSADALGELGTMLLAHNRGLDPKKAAKYALIIADPDDHVGTVEDQHFEGFQVLPISKANAEEGIDVMEIRTPDGRTLRLPASQGTEAIVRANRGLFIAAKKITEKNVGMTNERVIRDNNEYNLQREEDQRLQEEEKNRAPGMGRMGGAYEPPASAVIPPQPARRIR